MEISEFEGTKAESSRHKFIKKFLLKLFLKYSHNVKMGCLEKAIQNRRADIYLELYSGEKVVLEIQNSNISIIEALQRIKDYNKQNIFVLWVLNASGVCVGEPKLPIHKKNIKISPLELFLHKIYGGRTYYVNLDNLTRTRSIKAPFALHFSLSDNKTEQLRKKGFNYYYIRNSNFVKIPSMNLLCVDYGLKLARFYDKNYLKILREKILLFIDTNLKPICSNCQLYLKRLRRCQQDTNCKFKPITKKKLVKMIYKEFREISGTFLISEVVKDLKL